MYLKSLALVTLSWTLLIAVLLGIVSCSNPLPSQESISSSSLKAISNKRTGKYLELDDLNGFESSVSQLTQENVSGEELTEGHDQLLKDARPKRSPQSELEKREKTRQQQLQAQRNRIARQNAKKPRPGFFWTLARVTFETFNDTRSAIQQIGQIVNEAVPPEPAPRKQNLKKPIVRPPAFSKSLNATTTVTTQGPPTTTTEAEFKLTRPLLQSLIRRNVKGLVRLFNIEWRDALNQSEKNVQEFQRDLGKQLGIYLQDNPNNY